MPLLLAVHDRLSTLVARRGSSAPHNRGTTASSSFSSPHRRCLIAHNPKRRRNAAGTTRKVLCASSHGAVEPRRPRRMRWHAGAQRAKDRDSWRGNRNAPPHRRELTLGIKRHLRRHCAQRGTDEEERERADTGEEVASPSSTWRLRCPGT
ncbi:hypothetical protein MRX96_007776 [Rhipicephalus microplus]